MKSMKKIYGIMVGLVLVGFTLVSCDGMLGSDSDQILLPSDHDLNSPDKNFYTINGILSEVEKLSLQYVLLGELRGDLMQTTSHTENDLQEIYNFDVSADNKFNDTKSYYSVINLCNYMIANIDTAIVMKGEKINLRDYAAAKGIRAWTYMQLALNYGKVKYIEQPLLDVSEANQDFPEYTFDDLAPILIKDLAPWADFAIPDNFSWYELFNIRMLLGDLYLWTGQYENAANQYYNLMQDQYIYIGSSYVNKYDGETNGIIVEDGFSSTRWLSTMFSSNTITRLRASAEYNEDGSPLDSLNYYNNQLAPSGVAINNWESQTYYQTSDVTIGGDLRGGVAIKIIYVGGTTTSKEISFVGSYVPEEYYDDYFSNSDYDIEKGKIVKFQRMGTRSLTIYREAQLYLRYAEAVNQLGKPNLAFAVLKNGLGPTTLASNSLVPIQEKYISNGDGTYSFIPYVDFSNRNYWMRNILDSQGKVEGTEQVNIGIHGRGCGNVNLADDYVIPAELESLQDSMLYVEDKIVEELALETAFEGNRFHDLMRIAKRRGDNSYLADRVSAKYSNAGTIQALLMNDENWYLPGK